MLPYISIPPIISDNYSWIFSGIGVVALGWISKIIIGTKTSFPQDSSHSESNNNNSNSITNNILINGNNLDSDKKLHNQNNEINYKSIIRILFIDDDTKFKVVNILKEAGWINTKSKKDIINLDDLEAKEANIIFVDINGVGQKLFPQDQGLGLAQALKKKYPEKKIIIYSAIQDGDRFHKAWNEIDGRLSKNADPYEFQSLIESFSQDIFKL